MRRVLRLFDPASCGLVFLERLRMNLKLPCQSPTEVYVSDVGYVCILQTDPMSEGQDPVCIAPENITAFIRLLRQAKAEAMKKGEK